MILTDEQQAAVSLVVDRSPRICCITGWPGTGKSTVVRSILQGLRAQGRSCSLAAPSGKAAQRLEEATGAPAATLHRLLRLRPEGTEPPTPLTSEVVIVDEASMVDCELMAALVRACFGGCGLVRTLVLVGDPDQLPPVGPGEPFNDLIAADGMAPTVRLTQVQRQGEGSGIALAAARIREGRVPEWAPDCQLVECADGAEIPGRVWQLIAEHDLDPGSSQILAPQRTAAMGIEALNHYVERARRPFGVGGEAELLRGTFREGTKVIHTKNDAAMGLFNGELGEVIDVVDGNPASQIVRARMGREGQVFDYRGGAIKMLRPAWALTCHRAQGSEWPDVIVVAHESHRYMLTRSLLYVAATRAASRLWVVGTERAVELAVRNHKKKGRRTMLKRLVEARRAERAA